MNGTVNAIKRHWLLWLSTLMAVITVTGVGIILYSATLPRTARSAECTKQEREYYNAEHTAHAASTAAYYRYTAACHTNANSLLDLGIFLTIAAPLLALTGVAIHRLHKRQRTPSRLWLYLVAIVGVVSCVIGSVVGIIVSLHREAYAPGADSIGIPIFGLIFMTPLFLAIITGVVLLLTMRYREHAKPLYDFRGLPIGYKVYFVLALVGAVVLVWPMPVFDVAVTFAAYVLFNALLYIGISRK